MPLPQLVYSNIGELWFLSQTNFPTYTLLLLIFEAINFRGFRCFWQSSRKFALSKNVTLENSVIFGQFWGSLQDFNSESTENMYPRNTVISITAKINISKVGGIGYLCWSQKARVGVRARQWSCVWKITFRFSSSHHALKNIINVWSSESILQYQKPSEPLAKCREFLKAFCLSELLMS